MGLELAYRPGALDEVVGNESLVDSLYNVLNRPEEDRPKVYMFYGPAGCGKTTLARVVKETIGCKDCDYHEVDASSERGVKDIRSLKQKIQYAPLSNGPRMITFDECHGVTAIAQEAMLKMLEEPPDRCYFALCTTEPQALKNTLMRRCKKYEVKPLFPQEMRDFIAAILDAEEKEADPDLIERLVKISNGSPGEMLSYLDQVLEMEPKQALDVLNKITMNVDVVRDIVNTLIDFNTTGKWAKLAPLLKKMSQDPEQARRYILTTLSNRFLNSGGEVLANMTGLFAEPFYDSGKAGFILACYYALLASGDTEPF